MVMDGTIVVTPMDKLIFHVGWKFARLKPVVDTRQTSDCDVGGGFDGHLPSLLDCLSRKRGSLHGRR